ncbi:response regulator transcription factor [Streptomyces sp. NPDC058257]|uniref:response regulator transcription factor n=1 Tax=Streptomyces sp. NPDC058257 TaxID=3346409 RepID=UPI0036E7CE2B
MGYGSDAAAGRIAALTPAERDILRLLGTGLSIAEIAARLQLSSGTVKAHISSILTRTDCTNRVQAAVLAQDCGGVCNGLAPEDRVFLAALLVPLPRKVLRRCAY